MFYAVTRWKRSKLYQLVRVFINEPVTVENYLNDQAADSFEPVAWDVPSDEKLAKVELSSRMNKGRATGSL